jgi:nitrogen fixation/metabolism regulation signal transduction histidine kinase
MLTKLVALAVLAALGAAGGALVGAVYDVGWASLGAALGAGAGAALAFWQAAPLKVEATEGSERPRLSASIVKDRIIAAIADNVPDAVVLFRDVGTIVYANAVARTLFFEGVAPEGENFIRLVSAASAPLRGALLGETDRFFSVDANGQESYYLSRRNFVVDDESLTLLVVKHMTREVRRREVEVLKRVVRVVSHEVNNSLAPITSLMHSARLIAEKQGQLDKYRRVFDTIDERSHHLRAFLDGYVALAKLPAPRIEQEHWTGVLEQVATLYPELKLPDAPDKPAWFDRAQIEQALINLVKNAYESAGPPDAVELRIQTESDGTSQLEVLDRGPGFSEDALKNALLPLYTTKIHGSGMGLALTREIIEAHGGALELTNREGGGACMRVFLPGRSPKPTLDASRSRLTLTRA